MRGSDLDRHITGNWGEDQFPVDGLEEVEVPDRRAVTGTLPTIAVVLEDIAEELADGRLNDLHVVWLRNIAKQLDGPHIYFDRRDR